MLRSLLCCLLLTALAVAPARAHDLLSGNTNLRLGPESMQVDFVIARIVAKGLLDHPPAAAITDDNFADLYQPPLQKVAAGLFTFTLDGKAILPEVTEVALSEETDVKFTFLFTRPPAGRLALAAPVLNKIPGGFVNSIALNEGSRVLGYGDQRDGDPPWEISLPAAPAPAKAPAAAPAANSASASDDANDEKPYDGDTRLPFWGYVGFGLLVFLVFLYCERLRRQRPPPAGIKN